MPSSMLSLLTLFLLSGVECSLKVVVITVLIANDVHVLIVPQLLLLLLLHLLAGTHHFHLLDHDLRHVNVAAVEYSILGCQRRPLQIAFACD
jgi:hypothetical protein